jgi:hypothetical protein
VRSSVPVREVDRYGRSREPQLMNGEPGSSMSSTSQLHAHSERAWASGLTLDHCDHVVQPQMMYDGSVALKPSPSTEWRPRSASGRSSAPYLPFDHNEYRAVSFPVDENPVPYTPPAYNPWEGHHRFFSSSVEATRN